MTSLSLVHIIDIVTGKHYGLRPSDLRPMTQDEIEQYNNTPPRGSPTQPQIAAESAKIREGWSSKEAESRRRPVQDFFNLIVS
jgi:hypothetical protein